jgi:CGNR zinc finger protein/putative stress-induced transcription regulator
MMDVRTRLAVDDLLVVANTRHGPGGHHGLRGRAGQPMHDHLADPEDARNFLADHRVAVPAAPPSAVALGWLRLIRRHVRVLAGDEAGEHSDGPAGPPATEPLDEAQIRELFERYPVTLGADGELRPAGDPSGWAALIADLLPPLVGIRRERDRLRLCGNPLCRFMFVDRSRNASRVWCEGSVCGNRVRGHRHRLRQQAG